MPFLCARKAFLKSRTTSHYPWKTQWRFIGAEYICSMKCRDSCSWRLRYSFVLTYARRVRVRPHEALKVYKPMKQCKGSLPDVEHAEALWSAENMWRKQSWMNSQPRWYMQLESHRRLSWWRRLSNASRKNALGTLVRISVREHAGKCFLSLYHPVFSSWR